jgi:rRNA small subunit pseudouridine methyltransferase Nep1
MKNKKERQQQRQHPQTAGRRRSRSESESTASSVDSNDDREAEPLVKRARTDAVGAAPQQHPPLEVAPASATASHGGKHSHPLIILLDQATLETVKNKRGVYELLNCDDHREIIKRKLHKDPNEYRPDILHQELLAIVDSPLNKSGLVKIYIQTQKHVLIDVHPSIRIPRTYKRFAGLMVQLLHKMKIKAATEKTTLLKIIKNPFSLYLPAGTISYGMSCQGTLYRPMALAETLFPNVASTALSSGSTSPVCLVIGAMSTGHVTINDHPYIQEMFSISSFPLSGAAAISRILVAVEHISGIV